MLLSLRLIFFLFSFLVMGSLKTEAMEQIRSEGMKKTEATEAAEPILQLHAVIYGKVQGVFFRATTQRYAESLSIVGTVRNLDNGAVELYAQGTKKQLENLLVLLREQPGKGKVKQVDVSWGPVLTPFHDFSILY